MPIFLRKSTLELVERLHDLLRGLVELFVVLRGQDPAANPQERVHGQGLPHALEVLLSCLRIRDTNTIRELPARLLVLFNNWPVCLPELDHVAHIHSPRLTNFTAVPLCGTRAGYVPVTSRGRDFFVTVTFRIHCDILNTAP